MTHRYAVIGNPIEHSLSPVIHKRFAAQFKLSIQYDKIKGEDFKTQVLLYFEKGGKGMNVTLPFKQQAFELAHVATERSTIAKAANTLWIENGFLKADNTDGVGFMRDITRFVTLHHKHVCILGAGGAIRGVLQPLLDASPASVCVANRTADKLVALQRDFPLIKTCSLDNIAGRFDVIINSLPLSYDEEPPKWLEPVCANRPFCYDLIYDLKKPTPFVVAVKNHGCEAMDGLGMLIEQAAESFYIWEDKMPDIQHDLKQWRMF